MKEYTTVTTDGLSGFITGLLENTESEAFSADAIIRAYKSADGDAELSDCEKRYFSLMLEKRLPLLEETLNPHIFEEPDKRLLRYFYCPSGAVVPQIYKNGLAEKEDALYRKTTVAFSSLLKGKTYFEKLAVMDGAGCPTRLTRVTSNPLAALYFACEEGDGSVSVFAVPEDEISYPESDRVLMLSCLPLLSASAKRELYELADASLSAGRFQQLKGGSRYLEECAEELYRQVTNERPYFRREMVPADLLRPAFVQPGTDDALSVRSGAAYIINGLCKSEAEANRKLSSEVVLEIKVNDTEKTLSELYTLGVNGASLCPGTPTAAKYIKDNIR